MSKFTTPTFLIFERTFADDDDVRSDSAVTLAECPGERPFELLNRYVSADEKMFSMAITFDLMGVDHHGKGWVAARLRSFGQLY